MTGLNEISPLLTNALQTVLAVTLLMVIVLLVRKPFARHFGAKAAYMLWLVPLARLFMPPLPANLSLFGFLAPAQDAPEPATAPMEFTFGRSGETAIAPPPAPLPSAHIEWTAAEPAGPSLLDGVLAALPSMIGPLWLVGTVLMLGLAWRKQVVFHQLIRDDSSPASDAVDSAAREIAASLKLRRDFTVRTSLLNGSPLVTGFLKPVILLPEWFEADYTPREQRDALTHELMHIKRGDLFALHVAQIMLAVQWFNPLAHVAIRAFRVDQEAACDADVLRAGTSSAFSYGRTLVKAARLAGPADTAFSGANLTLAHPIKERLILMQNAAPTFRRRLLGSALAATLGSAALFATASCAASASPKDAPPAELAGGNDGEVHHETRKHTKVLRFSSHGDNNDHQFVLLSDPFDKLHPRMQELHRLDLSDLEEEMRVLSVEIGEVAKLESLKVLEGMDFSDLKALGKLEELGKLEGLAELGNMTFDFDLSFDGMDIKTIETDEGVRIIIPNQEIFISKLDGEDFEFQIEKIEALAEAHAERAEAFAEAHAARAEEMAEAHAKRAEKMAIVIERNVEKRAERMEEIGELMEKRIELAFEGGLEDDMEAAGEVIEDLADQCEDRDEDETGPVILSARGEDGETYRALCVAGDRSRLSDEDVKTFVQTHPALNDAEKARFGQQGSMSYEFSWTQD